jgi:hypothetical protein
VQFGTDSNKRPEQIIGAGAFFSSQLLAPEFAMSSSDPGRAHHGWGLSYSTARTDLARRQLLNPNKEPIISTKSK